MDFIKKNPFKIVRVAKNKAPMTTLIIGNSKLYGDIQAVYNLKMANKPLTRISDIKSYYGADWELKLGLNDKLEELYVTGGVDDLTQEDILRGMNFAELSESAPVEEFKDENLKNKTDFIQKKMANVTINDIKAPDLTSAPQYKVSDVFIFPEDRFNEIKEKIYLASGVPPYRQHLFWIDSAGHAKTIYKIKTADGGEVYVDARVLLDNESMAKRERISKSESKSESISKNEPISKSESISKNESTIMGIASDQYMFNNYENISIIALDTFKTAEDLLLGIDKIFILDLNDLIAHMRDVLMTDSAKRNLVFKSIVYKFYPWITEAIFYQYLQDESSLFNTYPLLAPNKAALNKKYDIEAHILDKQHAYRQMDISITMAVASVTTGARINIRNLFERLKTSRNNTFITAYILHGAVKYNFVKHYVGTPNITFPNNTRSGLTVAVPVNAEELYARSIALQTTTETQVWSKRTYIFFNIQPDGMIYILSHWGDDEKINFDILLKKMIKLCNPIIDAINAEHNYVFMGTVKQLPYISELNVRYPDITVSIFWPRIVNDVEFKELRREWDPFLEAGILSLRPAIYGGPQMASVVDMLLHKGTTEYDINQIMRSSVLSKIKNYYEHLTNINIHQVWEKLYSGRVVRMIHRTSDIKFELYNITQNNYLRFRQYLDVYLASASKIKIKGEVQKEIKKLKKLQEVDPDLYNMRKYGSDKLYTVLCQEPRQPLIYANKNEAPKNAVEYKNFTTGKSAYYVCEQEHPILSFITGIHPMGYCLPCCKKKLSGVNMRDDPVCNKTGKLDESSAEKSAIIIPGKSASTIMRHVVSFGKELAPYRIGMAPHDIIQYFETLGYKNIYLFGVNQVYPGVIDGTIGSLAIIANKSVQELVLSFIKYLKSGIGFETLMSGEIVNYFESLDNLIGTIHKLFISEEFGAVQFKYWSRLFGELFKLVENIDIIIINARYEQSITLEISTLSDKVGVLLVQDSYIYPIVGLIQEEYFKEGLVQNRYFDGKKFNDLKSEDVNIDVDKLIQICETAGLKDVAIQTTHQRIVFGVSGFDGDVMALITFQPFILSHTRTTQRKLDKLGDSAIAGKLAKQLLTGDIKTITDKNGQTYMRDDQYAVYFVAPIETKKESSFPKSNFPKSNFPVTVNYDAIELITALAENKEPVHDQLDELFAQTITQHKKYSQILMEFTYHLDTTKNEAVRTKLYEWINKININTTESIHEFNKQISNFDSVDIGIINSIIAQNINNKQKILSILESRKFRFDKQIYNDMAADQNLLIKINDIFDQIFEMVDIDDNIIENLSIPMAINKKKLKILKSDKKIYVELITADMKNPLKNELLKSGALSAFLILDMFKFTKYPNEIITVAVA